MSDIYASNGIGLYVHWPFCEAKCPYCDFNSHVRSQISQRRWLKAYLSEIDRLAYQMPKRVLNTVFFGGGTPSLMDPDIVGSIIEHAKGKWTTADNIEVTLEANPGSVEAGRFSAYASDGVNRISLGIQALRDADLRRLGRIHSVEDSFLAIGMAKKFFGRINLDFIYARQNQSTEEWRRELGEIVSIGTDHLSLYQLTIEPGTPFWKRHQIGKLENLPNDDQGATMFDVTRELCDSAGYSAYEISNHAMPESECRHNLVYWRYLDYIGIGPGAHGRITLDGNRYGTESHSMPEKWLRQVEAGSGYSRVDKLSSSEQACEYLLMTMRTASGADLEKYAGLSGERISLNTLKNLRELDLIDIKGNRVFATRKGQLLLNSVILELLKKNNGAAM
ncbi:MAG: radical SAM family heme chaperone HemW [Roseovarius sp.]|nr:radical SAM family heme chaperone HemW [Roseovarius sp.]